MHLGHPYKTAPQFFQRARRYCRCLSPWTLGSALLSETKGTNSNASCLPLHLTHTFHAGLNHVKFQWSPYEREISRLLYITCICVATKGAKTMAKVKTNKEGTFPFLFWYAYCDWWGLRNTICSFAQLWPSLGLPLELRLGFSLIVLPFPLCWVLCLMELARQ